MTDYVTFLCDTSSLAPATIRTRVSAIAFFYKTRLNYDPTKSPATDLLVKALVKQAVVKKKLPITQSVLKRLFLGLYQYDSIYLFHMFYIMYKFMYIMALRVSELLDYSVNFDHALKYEDMTYNTKEVHVTIRSSKHNVRPMSYTFACDHRLFWHINEYIRLRGRHAGPLFCFKDKISVSRQFFADKLQEDLSLLGYDNNSFNTHSFRAGRTTDLALEGASDRQIAIIGRWQSDAFREYIRPTHVYL